MDRERLGFGVTNRTQPAMRIATETLKRVKAKLRSLTWRWQGQSLKHTLDRLIAYVRGWVGSFRQAATPSVFECLGLSSGGPEA
jgi:hypothetical protein